MSKTEFLLLIRIAAANYHTKKICGSFLPHEIIVRRQPVAWFVTCGIPCAPMKPARALDRRSVSTTAVHAAPCPSPNSKKRPARTKRAGRMGQQRDAQGTRGAFGALRDTRDIWDTREAKCTRGPRRIRGQCAPGQPGTPEAEVHPGHLGNPGHPRQKCARNLRHTRATQATRGARATRARAPVTNATYDASLRRHPQWRQTRRNRPRQRWPPAKRRRSGPMFHRRVCRVCRARAYQARSSRTRR